MSTSWTELQTQTIKALRDGPWAVWELAVITKVINKHLIKDAVQQLVRQGILVKTEIPSVDPATGKVSYRYTLTKGDSNV